MSRITKDKLSTLTRTVGAAYAAELDALKRKGRGGVGFSARQIEDMKSAHADGMRNMITALRAASVLEVEDAETHAGRAWAEREWAAYGEGEPRPTHWYAGRAEAMALVPAEVTTPHEWADRANDAARARWEELCAG